VLDIVVEMKKKKKKKIYLYNLIEFEVIYHGIRNLLLTKVNELFIAFFKLFY
jgi:hypothetical protein